MFEPEEIRRWERQLAAMLKAAGSDDVEGFASIVKMLDRAASEGVREAAAQLRSTDEHGVRGFSWQEIAGPLGVTRSAAAQRFSRRTR
jgi:hypothetical protein